MYKFYQTFSGEIVVSYESDDLTFSFVRNSTNYDYQRFLDLINKEGSSVAEGIPEEILADAADKLFSTQLSDYKRAVKRLEQYEVSVGRESTVEEVVVGERVSKRTIPAIDPVEPTVEVDVFDPDSNVTRLATVRNPLIVKDEEERAAAQAIVDATPEEVKAAA